MKKKGFTLIELLAVIVILAIIALIATPLVLKYIEKSRKESKVDSAYSFVRNLETEIANYAIKNNGKKYTTDKESIKELGLDITVKGENPEDGKVCISNVGQVEKGVFQYGKYYVSYDGKKGSISDKDTYDNFSCSGNDSNSIVLAKDSLVNFQKSENLMVGIIEEDVSSIISLLTIPSESHFIVKDKNTKEVIIDAYVLYWDDIYNGDIKILRMTSEMSKNDYKYMASISSNNQLAVAIDSEIHPNFVEGEYFVDFVVGDREFIPYMFQVDAGGTNWLMGYNFVEGDVHVLITDGDGTVYCDKSMELSEWESGYYGNMSHDGYDLGDLDNVYNAIANGKIITVKATQNVAGKDVVTTIVGNNPVYNVGNSPMNSKDTYSIGNNLLPIGA